MSTLSCVSLCAMKNGRRKADLSPAAAIYAALTEAVQPPDDRTYSAEVTGSRRNLLHHRSARAEFPYTRSIMIPPFCQFVKWIFRKNHKIFYIFSSLLQKIFSFRSVHMSLIQGFSAEKQGHSPLPCQNPSIRKKSRFPKETALCKAI